MLYVIQGDTKNANKVKIMKLIRECFNVSIQQSKKITVDIISKKWNYNDCHLSDEIISKFHEYGINIKRLPIEKRDTPIYEDTNTPIVGTISREFIIRRMQEYNRCDHEFVSYRKSLNVEYLNSLSDEELLGKFSRLYVEIHAPELPQSISELYLEIDIPNKK